MVRILTQSLKVITIAALTLMVIGSGVWAFRYATEAARPGNAGQPVMLSVFEGQTDSEVADELESQGLIKSKMLFQGQLRLSGGALVPGTYTLRRGMSVPQIVDSITGAAPAEEPVQASNAPESFDITIPEGWRIEQIAEEYERLGGEGGAEAFIEAVETIDRSQFDFLADLPADASLEGYLFPDTYRFSGTNPTANVATMLTNFGNKYTPEMRQRTAEMGLTLEQVLTVASLVEREAQLPEERPTIADVYLSRWEQGWRLDADPTVQYALGKSDDWWPKLSGDDLFAESPYNTYQNDGLPPGPIANPGFASIQAVLFPNDTPYMYFVAKGDSGEHAFAVTAEEQQANVDQYLNNPDGGQ
ncbi:MAG: endolytic transglycosylase MltG [Thermomicrobiales bacterium]|nr:endolytic transglycosylase MltG [Thermomicrobiales bacterium]